MFQHIHALDSICCNTYIYKWKREFKLLTKNNIPENANRIFSKKIKANNYRYIFAGNVFPKSKQHDFQFFISNQIINYLIGYAHKKSIIGQTVQKNTYDWKI